MNSTKCIPILIAALFFSANQLSAESTFIDKMRALDTTKPTLVGDMEAFDRAYIPVLILTSEKDFTRAQKAMAALKIQWQVFQMRYGAYAPNDQAWQGDLTRIDNAIRNASILLGENDLPTAHEALESVRVIFMELRERHDIDYFIDDLTAFHTPMESIVQTAKQRKPSPLTPEDIQHIRAQLPEAYRLWKKVENRPFNAELFEFQKDKIQKMKTLVAQESQALTALASAIDSGDAQAIAQKAVALKPNFTQILMMFGDFKSIR